MTIVEAWQLWPFWRLLVWAAVGATLLAFALPSPEPQPRAALPPLPPPSYRPPVAASPQSALFATPAPPASAAKIEQVPQTEHAASAPEQAATAVVAAPAVKPLIVLEGLPPAIPKRDPGTYNADPRLLKPRPLVQP